ncbi:MAG: mechanosensitive ion channel family protein [Oscillospiraceae bacterium]
MDAFLAKLEEIAGSAGVRLAGAILLAIIGSIIIKKIGKRMANSKRFGKKDPTLAKFLVSAIKVLLYGILIVTVVAILGVPTASIVTLIGTMGVTIGLALQGALTNLAGGIMLMVFRPFNAGDFVTAGGESGTVKEISLFYTKLVTLDNKDVLVPNGTMMNSNVTNFSSEENRRVDIDFTFAREEDTGKVSSIMKKVMSRDSRILPEPEPFAMLTSSSVDSLTFTARAWVKSEDYWPVYQDLLSAITDAMNEEGVKAPTPRFVTEEEAKKN